MMYRILKKLSFFQVLNDRLGNRGMILFFVGLPWMLIGYGFISMPMDRFSRPGPDGPLQFLDNPPWPGLMWVVGGFLAIVCAWTRIYSKHDSFGWNGIIIPPFVWGMFFWLSWGFNMYDSSIGRPNNWLAGSIFWTFTLLLMFIAAKFKDDPGTPHKRYKSHA